MKNRECIKLLITTPVYNDWEAFRLLVEDLDLLIANNYSVSILAINDGSIDNCTINFKYKSVVSIEVINLTTNMGHQRAISVGLSSIDTEQYDLVIVMDSDGEDKVTDISRLIESFQSSGDIVVAHRGKRSEGVLFKLFYFLYKAIFKFLTGHKISFGNFSLIPAEMIVKITSMPESWNNFPASLIKSKLPISYVETKRGVRYFGCSKMNFSSLLLHGFSAISVFSEIVIIRSIMTFVVILILAMLSLSIAYSLHFFVNLYTFPEWATTIIWFLVLMTTQILVFLFIIAFVFLSKRSDILPTPKNMSVKFIHSIDKF